MENLERMKILVNEQIVVVKSKKGKNYQLFIREELLTHVKENKENISSKSPEEY